MFLLTTAYAEGTQAVGQEAMGGGAMIASFLPLILIFVFMWMIMIRPQRKKEKALRNKINEMKVGDKITSIGGIRGKVSKIKDDFVIIETGNIGTQDEKSYIKLSKSAISDIETKIKN